MNGGVERLRGGGGGVGVTPDCADLIGAVQAVVVSVTPQAG